MDEEITENKINGLIRFATYLPQTDDLTLLILKGHLLIEEQLISILKESVRNMSAIHEARLHFYNRFLIIKALKYNEDNKWVWIAIKNLNELRNELAHKIDSPKVKTKLRVFLDHMASIPIYGKMHKYDENEDTISKLRGALAFLAGLLEGNYVRK